MTHKPITINNISLKFPHKSCFEDFNTIIQPGVKIGIIGQNGNGKSTLLSMLLEEIVLSGAAGGIVKQIIDEHNSLSGGEKFNKSLSEVLSQRPEVLLLDEPTNHLDIHNRRSLLRMLNSYSGTLIIVSHDEDVLRDMDVLWHIYNGKINVFSGNYDDYKQSLLQERQGLESELYDLKKRRNAAHEDLMQEQKRASKAAEKGRKSIDQRKWPTIVSNSKFSRAQETSGNKNSAIKSRRENLLGRLQDLRLPEIITPSFSLGASKVSGTILHISNGEAAYSGDVVLSDINIHLYNNQRIAILGKNGSGKSTLLKAILAYKEVEVDGSWVLPQMEHIGYLDQNYSNLDFENTVIGSLAKLAPDLKHDQLRKHLNDFLFRKNEEVNAKIQYLSGGERARLSLAHIAIRAPKLLVLDEITNNLDMETKNHTIQVLSQYPGAMIVVSHDTNFLRDIGIEEFYQIENGTMSVV